MSAQIGQSDSRVQPHIADITSWRRDIHQHPELEFDVHRTAGLVAEKLRGFGVDEVVEGIGRTGVVGVIKRQIDSSGLCIGLRADMDAFPIFEDTQLDYASTVNGKMHACGHDGHTAMLLGAAKVLCESRQFNGTAVVIFQPAEAYGAAADVHYMRDYPATINVASEASFAASVASHVVGASNVGNKIAPLMGAEDFSFMLNERPGAFIFIGNGESAGLHHPQYNFNDDAIGFGCSYWIALVESAMPISQ